MDYLNWLSARVFCFQNRVSLSKESDQKSFSSTSTSRIVLYNNEHDGDNSDDNDEINYHDERQSDTYNPLSDITCMMYWASWEVA